MPSSCRSLQGGNFFKKFLGLVTKRSRRFKKEGTALFTPQKIDPKGVKYFCGKGRRFKAFGRGPSGRGRRGKRGKRRSKVYKDHWFVKGHNRKSHWRGGHQRFD